MVDLHCHSCFSFLDGASTPRELVEQAVALGYTSLALTDHNGVYGSIEFAHAAQEAGLQAITGAEVTLEDDRHLTLLAETPQGYANLCRLLTTAHRTGERRFPLLPYAALAEHTAGLIALSGCPRGEVPHRLARGDRAGAERAALRLREWFGADGFFLEAQQNLVHGDTLRLRALADLSRRTGIPLVATNNTHYHVRARCRLQDTLVAIRHGLTLDEAHPVRRANSEFALKRPETLRARFRDYPEAVENALALADRCRAFNLTRDLGYSFPDFADEWHSGQKQDADTTLRRLCEEALVERYADAPRERRQEARAWLEEELRLVRLHGLGGFFLVYRDLLQLSKQVAVEVRGERPRGRFDLPPGRGRGSAVSSIICYLIGLSPVDPVQARLFLGRFLNESFRSVPDIDLDFPREIRAELIRRVHEHYGYDHVAMVNIMPAYRFRSAVREVGKALGLPAAELDRLARMGEESFECPVAEGATLLWQLLWELSRELQGMPRHVSQHVGGLLLSSRPLLEIVPLERSAMDGRQVAQWDKDSCDLARMIKVDFLALGMLSAAEDCLDRIVANGKPLVDLTRISFQDRAVYRRIGRGETVGAFQVESRAQIGMLVRTQPQTMEELAVQVAIVRPGPIVGNAVNPYVSRRERKRRNPHYTPPMEHPLLAPVLEDTLGIMVYQDQVMEVCKALAGFTDGEADQLRRAMSRKRSREGIEQFRELFYRGAAGRGVPIEVAESMFEKVIAFSEFGFPKSHAAAFAVLAYQSVWLLHYYPAEYVASLLNAQPMGFYAPDSLIKEFQRRGIQFLSPDVNQSEWDCTVRGRTVRLGLQYVSGLGKERGMQLCRARMTGGPFQGLPDFCRRIVLPDRLVERLVLAGAMDGFGLNRRELVWQMGLLYPDQIRERKQADGSRLRVIQGALPLSTEQDQVELPGPGPWERMAQQYEVLHLSVSGHPVAYLRPSLVSRCCSIRELLVVPDGTRVRVAGLVTCRQRPYTARGILFLGVEDETGLLNVVVPPEIYAQDQQTFRLSPLVVIEGILESRTRRQNLLAEAAWPIQEFLPDPTKSAAGRRIHEALHGWAAPAAHHFR